MGLFSNNNLSKEEKEAIAQMRKAKEAKELEEMKLQQEEVEEMYDDEEETEDNKNQDSGKEDKDLFDSIEKYAAKFGNFQTVGLLEYIKLQLINSDNEEDVPE